METQTENKLQLITADQAAYLQQVQRAAEGAEEAGWHYDRLVTKDVHVEFTIPPEAWARLDAALAKASRKVIDRLAIRALYEGSFAETVTTRPISRTEMPPLTFKRLEEMMGDYTFRIGATCMPSRRLPFGRFHRRTQT